MGFHKTGCLICGRDLHYFDPARTLACSICGREHQTAASCADGHFVCDRCHAQPGYESITRQARQTDSRDPAAIAREMMAGEFINMHGPEHHYLVVAALLAAYKNSDGDIDLDKTLAVAAQRTKKVPGGICGHWGACGAGIGSGIFVSLVTGASPLSAEEWRLANEMTSASLGVIAKNGGPRCCKRDTWLALLTAADFARERLGVPLEKPAAVRCSFFGKNPTCLKQNCLFYPPADAAPR